MDLGLNAKVVLVLGSSKGIGLSIASGLLEEGAKVILNARNEETLRAVAKRLSCDYPGRVDYVVGDACLEPDSERIAQYVADKYEKLDVFVGNIGSGKPMAENPISPSEIRRFYDINVVGNISVLEKVSFLLEKGSNPSIILISSVVAKEVSAAPCGYAAAKSAVITITKYLSQSYTPKGIRVNCILPGNIYFEGGRWEELKRHDSEGVKKYIDENVPMKRFGKPEEIADAVAFLISNRALFITGATMAVDGGQLSAI